MIAGPMLVGTNSGRHFGIVLEANHFAARIAVGKLVGIFPVDWTTPVHKPGCTSPGNSIDILVMAGSVQSTIVGKSLGRLVGTDSDLSREEVEVEEMVVNRLDRTCSNRWIGIAVAVVAESGDCRNSCTPVDSRVCIAKSLAWAEPVNSAEELDQAVASSKPAVASLKPAVASSKPAVASSKLAVAFEIGEDLEVVLDRVASLNLQIAAAAELHLFVAFEVAIVAAFVVKALAPASLKAP
jgi:hypothetical protein